MSRYHRREFLADVGRGMLVASVGSGMAQDLGLAPAALAGEGGERLTFGPMEPLVALMQETPADRLLPVVVERMKAGTDLRQLVAAAALANARSFGGQDYDGYHAIMALVPSYQMACELPEAQRALPVLKVLYRNTNHIQKMGGSNHEALHHVEPAAVHAGIRGAEALREATRRQDMDAAERTFAALAQGPLNEAYNDLQLVVQDYVDVHRVVLAWRSWALLDFTGKEHAHTLLRQSVRFCVDEEKNIHRYKNQGEEVLRALLPKLLDRRGLASRSPGDRRPDDAWIEKMSQTIYASRRDQAAEAVAEALADGVAPEVVGEAISLAANQLVLHDPGRRRADSPAKPDRQRPWRVGWRACFRRRQRLAEHRPGQRSPQHLREPDRRGLSHGRPDGRAQCQGVPVRRTPREGPQREARGPARRGGETPSRRRTRSAPARWSTATASSAGPSGPSSTCCSATRSAKTVPSTPRSTTAP